MSQGEKRESDLIKADGLWGCLRSNLWLSFPCQTPGYPVLHNHENVRKSDNKGSFCTADQQHQPRIKGHFSNSKLSPFLHFLSQGGNTGHIMEELWGLIISWEGDVLHWIQEAAEISVPVAFAELPVEGAKQPTQHRAPSELSIAEQPQGLLATTASSSSPESCQWLCIFPLILEWVLMWKGTKGFRVCSWSRNYKVQYIAPCFRTFYHFHINL